MRRRRKAYTTKGIGRTIEHMAEDYLVKQSLDADGKEDKEYVREGMKYFDYGELVGYGVVVVMLGFIAYWLAIAGGILAAIWFFSGVLQHGAGESK